MICPNCGREMHPDTPHSGVRRAKDWVVAHRFELAVAFILLNAAAIALDLFIVLVMGWDSISYTTWLAQQSHPTITGAGVLAGIGICSIVRTDWRLVMFAGIMTGHLFFHY